MEMDVEALRQEASVETADIHRNTSFRWRLRFMTGAPNERHVQLHGIADADETYLLEAQNGSSHLNRPTRGRGGKAKRRGISRELDCILVARPRWQD